MPPEYQENQPRSKKYRRLRIILSTLFLLVLVFAGATFYFYNKVRTVSQAEQPFIADEEVVALVGKHILLPEGEKPVVANVADVEALKDQPFFRSAQEGDMVLMYTSGRLILFRPSIEKVIEAGFLDASASLK